MQEMATLSGGSVEWAMRMGTLTEMSPRVLVLTSSGSLSVEWGEMIPSGCGVE
jgi:hypothetical protein